MTDDNFDIDVHVHIPRRHFKTLHREAIGQKVDVGHLIRALVIAAVPEAPKNAHQLTTAERDEYIRRRNSEGANDGIIARELGQAHSTIHSRRARLGITPVPGAGVKKQAEATS